MTKKKLTLKKKNEDTETRHQREVSDANFSQKEHNNVFDATFSQKEHNNVFDATFLQKEHSLNCLTISSNLDKEIHQVDNQNQVSIFPQRQNWDKFYSYLIRSFTSEKIKINNKLQYEIHDFKNQIQDIKRDIKGQLDEYFSDLTQFFNSCIKLVEENQKLKKENQEFCETVSQSLKAIDQADSQLDRSRIDGSLLD